jgi:hypothetical protein
MKCLGNTIRTGSFIGLSRGNIPSPVKAEELADCQWISGGRDDLCGEPEIFNANSYQFISIHKIYDLTDLTGKIRSVPVYCV